MIKTVTFNPLVSAINEAYMAESKAGEYMGKATAKAQAVATLMVSEYKLDKVPAGKLQESLNAAKENAREQATQQGMKFDATSNAWRNLWAHVSTFAVVLARPDTLIEVQTKKGTKEGGAVKVMKPARETVGNIAQAQKAAKAIREGEGMSGNNKTGKNGNVVPLHADAFDRIKSTLDTIMEDKTLREKLIGYIREQGYSVTAKADRKNKERPAVPAKPSTKELLSATA
jgi:hypothetical protein